MVIDDSVQRVTTPAGDPAWLVSSYHDVRALLGDARLGRSHPDHEKASRYSQTVIVGRPIGDPKTEQEDSARVRRLLGRLLAVRRVEAMRPRVQELVDGLLDDMEGRPRPVNFHETVAFPLPVLVICELLGVPYEDRDEFRRWSDDAADMLDRERSQTGMTRLSAYMRGLADRRRREPAGDLVSELVAAQEQDDRISDDGVARLAAMLLFAGHQTTVTPIDKGVVLLLTNPAQWETLRQDPSLVPQAVEEILRCPWPGQQTRSAFGIPRYALEDIEVGGVAIRAGDMVMLRLQTANGDERVFAEPDRFDVCRTENPHVTFGHGAHFCLGAALARIELQTMFAALVQRFPALRLARPPGELKMRSRIITGGLAELYVSW
jgi:pentalenolactone synthase